MLTPQLILPLEDELLVDLFAGGGGMSSAIEQALGRHVDIAVNHDADAVSQHTVNHPQTRHYQEDVFEVDPRTATQGRPVGLLHLSPDCRHHSQAAGGQPRDRKIRALSWVGKRWAGQVAPRIITLENVKQILKWGPLIAKRDKATGRVLKKDGAVANPGERVPLAVQYLIPDPRRVGQTWRKFVTDLRALGYVVEWRALCAADYGAPTTRERLFLVARRDGMPIQWPEPTHTKRPTRRLKRRRAAADCIDWTVPCPSIFDRHKPLAEATLRRIALGVQRYVLNTGNPFIVPVTHQGGDRVHDIRDPLPTITAAHRGEFMLGTPVLAPYPRAAYVMQANGGFNTVVGHDARGPLSTITHTGSQQQIVTAYLAHLRTHCDTRNLDDPLMTVSAKGQHHALATVFLSRQFGNSKGHGAYEPLGTITAGGGGKTAAVTAFLSSMDSNDSHHSDDQRDTESALSPEDENRALRISAFLIRYYGKGGQWGDLRDPMATITTRDRLALVTVTIHGAPYVIVDIGLRMLQPRELYSAQGFPDNYVIDRGHDGHLFTKSTQVRLVGNSVSPPPAVALIRANMDHVTRRRAAA